MFNTINNITLFADPECWEFMEKYPDEFDKFGCGAGKFWDRLIPDTVWFLSIKPACQIHDWYYRFYFDSLYGNAKETRKTIDGIFYDNMVCIVNAKTNFEFIKRLRMRRVKIYYTTVRLFGAIAFNNARRMI